MTTRRAFFRRRVPVVLQMTSVECGIACLTMILEYHGRRSSVSEIRERCVAGRDGITALTIAQAARAFGLDVRGLSLAADGLDEVAFPAIAHWDFRHFVVVEWVSKTAVGVVDPGLGRHVMTREEFAEGFTGVLLLFAPGPAFEKRRASGAPAWLRHVTGLAREAFPVLSRVLVASLGLQLFGLALPLLTQLLVDQVLPVRLAGVLPALGAGLLACAGAFAVTTYLRSILLVKLQAELDARMMLGFVQHLLDLPYRFFQQRTTGDLITRLAGNTQIRETLTGQMLALVLDSGLALLYLTLLTLRAPVFGAVTLLLGGVQALATLLSARRLHGLTQRELVAQAESQGYLVEALKGIVTLKVAGAEERALAQWSSLFFETLNLSAKKSRVSAAVDTFVAGFRLLSPLALLWLGAAAVLEGSMTIGTMLALVALATAVLVPLSSLVSELQKLLLVGAHLDRLADVLDAAPERATGALAPRLEGRIEARRLGFRYDPHGPFVLKDVSFVVEPGQKVALVGRTGSGKSTLALLLLGLYAETEGEVLYDGAPISSLDLRALRRQLGVVLQEPFLFGGTIRENIAMNDRSLTFPEIVEAARLAAVHDDIAAMPMSYETMVSEGTGGLSGGQRQRIALARALVRKPPVLLLDEATSHLDALTEQTLDESLARLSATRIVIAHRLSTVRNADQILVLDAGRITERGRHRELLAKNGAYAALVRPSLESRDDAAPVSVNAPDRAR